MSRELARLHREYRPPLRRGQEWWTDNPHRLAVRLRREVRAGRIQVVGRVELAPGFHGALIWRLKPEPRISAGQALTVAGCSLVLLAGLALARYTLEVLVLIWPVLLILGAMYAGLRRTAGHRPACVGLHCQGCRH